MENKNLLFFQIFVLHQGTWVRPWMGGSPQSFKKHLSLSDIQNWSASEGKGSCLTGLRHEELQVSGRKQKCVWCLGSFSGWHWSDKENWHDDTQPGGLREAHGVLGTLDGAWGILISKMFRYFWQKATNYVRLLTWCNCWLGASETLKTEMRRMKSSGREK